MCENCTKHGEGLKWFLNAKNYSDDLLTDLKRTSYVRRFFQAQARLVGQAEQLDTLRRVPAPARRLVKRFIVRKLADEHYGQVVSLAEAQKIIGVVGAVFRLPCVCRRISVRRESRYCLGFSLDPAGLGAVGLVDSSYWQGPDGPGLERLTPPQAVRLLEELDEEGLVHSVWTFKTPFIGGLCNCSATECRAMLATLSYDLPILHRGEAVASLDRAACVGCGACARRCPFDALHFDRDHRAVHLEAGKCFGCGLCVTACPATALHLAERLDRQG